ncbi:hypothetical protein BGX28_005291 [Mortierella sp. GBA30]|nr:hypothetical protein BGX28_005291 [Mortierella sp. GBA30]
MMTGPYQSFRSGDHTVRIQTKPHPVTDEPFVIWSDIKDCFPGLSRVQHGDIFVPMLRDDKLYRLKPHGIKYHPGIVLDVLYDTSTRSMSRPKAHTSNSCHTITSTPVRIHETALDSEGPPKDDTRTTSIDMAAAIETRNMLHEALLPIYRELVKAGISLDTILENTPYAGLSFDDDSPQLKDFEAQTQVADASVDNIAEFESHAFTILEEEEGKQKEVEQQQVNLGDRAAAADGNDKGEMMTLDQQTMDPDEHQIRTIPDSHDGQEFKQEQIDQQRDSTGSSIAISAATESAEDSSVRSSSDIPSNDNQVVKAEAQITAAVQANGTKAHRKQDKKSPFSIYDVVAHRAKDILAQRYDWLESPCPKLFIMVPHKEDVSGIADVKNMTWQDFRLYFLCDCGDIPGTTVDENGFFHSNGCSVNITDASRKQGQDQTRRCEQPLECGSNRCLPHVDINGHGYALQKEALAFGPYMMAILEMLEYGVTVDGVVKVPALTDNKALKQVMYAMAFLMMQGVEASHQVHAKGYSSLYQIKPTAPLKESEFMDLFRTRISACRPIGPHLAYRTVEGDIRWICYRHWATLSPRGTIEEAMDFHKHPDSKSSSFHVCFGSFVATVNTRKRAKEFYDLVEQMVTTPAIGLFLDWDLSESDEAELQIRLQSISAASVKIYVREREPQEIASFPGFGHGYIEVIMAALRNKKIQAFSLEKRVPGDALENNDELFVFKGSVFLDPVLARFTRELDSSKAQLGLLVTDLDKAADSMRRSSLGYRSLSRLTLEASYWDHISIKFGAGGEEDSGKDDLKDSEPNVLFGMRAVEPDDDLKESRHMEGVIEFFNGREHDAITVRTCLSADTAFLRTHALKDVNIHIIFPEDGPRIRELIKNNKRLKRIELAIDFMDDPCQVFEYFKSMMHNHPSLDSFQLVKDWGKNIKSNFVWQGVSDRSKMTLGIQSYAEDKIGPLLQKFGACIQQLFINSINSQDSAILDKVTQTRSRKGQLKLIGIRLMDAFSLTQTTLDDLSRVVLRNSLQRFSISGTVTARTAARLAEFMTTVASKITDIHLYGEHGRSVLAELAKRMPESSGMSMLVELKISGPFDATTKDLTWMRSLFHKKVPLTTIELHKVNLSHQGWMTLAQEIDFMHLKYFRVGPDVPLKNEAIAAFVSLVPADSGLENFHLDCEGMREALCVAFKNMLVPKLRKKTALVSIGRYF